MLDKAFTESCRPIKASVLTNPHNPLGQCYPKKVLEDCLRFCQRRNIQLVSEEFFALSTFNTCKNDLIGAPNFVSLLAIDAKELSCDPWSMSKDFGSAGIKLGCTVTQANPPLRNGLAMATFMNVSTLSTAFACALLSSNSLPSLVRLYSVRLAEAYYTLTGFFDLYGIYYVPCNAGLVILAKLAPRASSRDDEAAMVNQLAEAGVLVSAGQTYHVVEHGWARVSFAVERSVLIEGIKRMKIALKLADYSS